MSDSGEKGGGRKPRQALGRGLAAIFGDNGPLEQAEEAAAPAVGKIIDLPIERIEPNPFQPRRRFDEEALKGLCDSIRSQGVLQPLLVRPVEGGYQLVAGERRLRACQLAGRTSVPVVVRPANDQEALLLALLENLQREDLGPLEEASAYQSLTSRFGFTAGEIADYLGRDRSTVANAMRLLNLPAGIQEDLAADRLTAGHARALLALEKPSLMLAARDKVLAAGLSVRATEDLVRRLKKPPASPPEPDQAQVHLDSLASELRRSLGTKVTIRRKGSVGRLVIEFYNDSDLERLLARLR